MEPTPSALPIIRPIRLWPGLLAVGLYWLAAVACRWAVPGTMTEYYVRFYGPMAVAGALLVWWLAFSRTVVAERLLVTAAGVIATAAIVLAGHRTITFPVLVVIVAPYVLTVWVVSAALFTRIGMDAARRWGVALSLLAVAVVACLMRFDGILSGMTGNVSWRWSLTPEQRLLATSSAIVPPANRKSDGAARDLPPLRVQPGDWPEFRGPRRDGIVEGVRLVADWAAHPPREVWRMSIGPAWSSFLVVEGRLFTQEQRGDKEFVSCYDAATRRLLWSSADRCRYEDAVSGTGPRATPTFYEGRLYAFGGTGRLRCLDARTGEEAWSRDVRADAGQPQQLYGFASAPLVAEGLAAVFAGGADKRGVLAYGIKDGQPAWTSGDGTVGYCAVRREVFDGVPQFLCATNAGVQALDPATGRVLWSNEWPVDQARIVQPCRVDESHVLVGTGMNYGVRLLEIARQGEDWSAREVWTNNSIKPYYNDFVLHDGCLYGYDGTLLCAFDLAAGRRLWKKRGYNSGQLLLLREQGLLVVLDESGKVSLLTAERSGPRDLGSVQAFSGKSWSHPVIAHGRLYVRNAEDAVCYELATEPAGTIPTTATTEPAEQP